MPEVTTITLPFPPSINHYWRRVGARTLISRGGRAFREHAIAACPDAPNFGDARLAVHIVAMMPDRRRRDLDNLLKPLLDALEHAGVYDNDSQIDLLRIDRGEVCKPGRVEVSIRVVDPGETA